MTRKRGRVSTAALIVGPPQPTTDGGTIERLERPVAPHDLVDEEVEVWASVVGSMPADWFKPENMPLLTQYCRHVVRARHIAEWIEQATGIPGQLSVKDYDRLLRMQVRESATMGSLAAKMRISQSAIRNDRGNDRKGAVGKRPWEA